MEPQVLSLGNIQHMSNRKYSVKECVDLSLNPLSLTGLCERSHWLYPVPSEIQEVPKSDRMNKPHVSGIYCYSANHPQGWWFKRKVTLYWSGFYGSGRAWKGWLCSHCGVLARTTEADWTSVTHFPWSLIASGTSLRQNPPAGKFNFFMGVQGFKREFLRSSSICNNMDEVWGHNDYMK